MLAVFLYQLGLVEEADDFRNRVLALAPTSAIAYRVEMLRAIAIGDEVGSIATAQSAIEADIENRRFAFVGAVQHLLRAAARDNNVEEVSGWIEEQAPGIFDLDSERVPQKYRMAQGAAFDAWYVSLPRDEMLRRLDVLLRYGEALGLSPLDNPNTYLSILALRGETEKAADVALERVLVHSVASNLGWRERFGQAQYADVVADPRIKDALQRWENEEAALRGKVQAYFADLQAAT
jgi:hypothetical protein